MNKHRPNKGRQLLHVANRSKGLILLFSVLLSLLLIVVSTYAWQTYSDEKLNRVKEETGSFDVVINEVFQTNLNFQPGKKHTKEVTAKNLGESPVVLRISFYEFFLAFAHDYSDGEGKGNGNLIRVDTAGNDEVVLRDVTTWQNDHTYAIDGGHYLVGEKAYQSTLGDITTAFNYGGTANHEAFSYINLGFNDTRIFTTVPSSSSGETHYWLYYNNYFYYSEVLNSSEETPQLLQNVTLSTDLPNRFEGALYQIVPYLESHEIQANSFTGDWDLTGTPMATMYSGKLT